MTWWEKATLICSKFYRLTGTTSLQIVMVTSIRSQPRQMSGDANNIL